ncbi:MAG: helix-turn-helix transcriptional regulator [Actinomycetota bacterium]|nr:helix-turn-helix transcriptional regulator [Actinomycetota bacterium]
MSRRERRTGYRWNLRTRLAEHGMWQTTELGPLLADRGIELSTTQIYRLVTQTPERLNLHVLAALCDILDCTANDLIETYAEVPVQRRRVAGKQVDLNAEGRPRRASVARDLDA